MRPSEQHLEVHAPAFGDDFDPPVRAISHPSGKPQTSGLVHSGLTKEHPLHTAADD